MPFSAKRPRAARSAGRKGGRVGGRSRSEAKVQASRENGKRGGDTGGRPGRYPKCIRYKAHRFQPPDYTRCCCGYVRSPETELKPLAQAPEPGPATPPGVAVMMPDDLFVVGNRMYIRKF